MGPLHNACCVKNAPATSEADQTVNSLNLEHIFPSWRRIAVEKELFDQERIKK
jgi:hypothetical protein